MVGMAVCFECLCTMIRASSRAIHRAQVGATSKGVRQMSGGLTWHTTHELAGIDTEEQWESTNAGYPIQFMLRNGASHKAVILGRKLRRAGSGH